MKSDRLLSIFTETDVNTKTEVLKDVIQSTLDLHAPIKTIKIRSRSNTFVTPDMKELMKSRNKLHIFYTYTTEIGKCTQNLVKKLKLCLRRQK